MSSTLLEQTRQAHEEVERLERQIVADFKTEAITHKERLLQNHRVNRMLDDMASKSKRLRTIYADEDRVRKEEIAELAGNNNVFGAFYDRLREVRDFHKAYPGFHAATAADFVEPFKQDNPLEFSGEEANGRYLDLHAFYNRFINSPFGTQMDYGEYLSTFAEFSLISRSKKFSKAYSDYLSALLEYLQGFHKRTQPLIFLETILRKASEEFAEQWNAGVIQGWEDKGQVRVQVAGEGILDLEVFNSPDELATLGAEAIKDALGKMGLKQGGTEQQRLERLWSTRGKRIDQIDRKLFAKGAAPAKSEEHSARRLENACEIARLEVLVERMVEQMRGAVDATRSNVEKKATLSVAELEAEQEEDDDWVEEEAEDEEEEIYNPLKLPLGWDGKPIPYWLYKLHGLNIEFTCEICGNYSYWGRRAYERHFKEWRHQHGMRCLRIPNTKAFNEVTTIAEAMALHKAMEKKKEGVWDRSTDEEYEDADGNVYNKKTYEDLRKQGLI